MMIKRLGMILLWTAAAVFTCMPSSPVTATTYYGPTSTGLLELPGYGYPVFLFVPDGYDPVKEYPLLISIPDEGQSAEEFVKQWAGAAKRQSFFVMTPTNLRPQDTPTKMDEWILRIKKDVLSRYRISPTRIFLVGQGDGAHYASYLGINHPNEFTAVALLDGSWVGRFESLLHERKGADKQLPFYVAMTADEERRAWIEETKQKAADLEEKGYPIFLREIQGEGAFQESSFIKELIEWLNDHSQVWLDQQKVENKTLKSRLRIWWERNLKV